MINKEKYVTFDHNNLRGSSEHTFDMQNNNFGWKHLPFSFMIFTALILNFFVWLVGKIAATARP